MVGGFGRFARPPRRCAPPPPPLLSYSGHTARWWNRGNQLVKVTIASLLWSKFDFNTLLRSSAFMTLLSEPTIVCHYCSFVDGVDHAFIVGFFSKSKLNKKSTIGGSSLDHHFLDLVTPFSCNIQSWFFLRVPHLLRRVTNISEKIWGRG